MRDRIDLEVVQNALEEYSDYAKKRDAAIVKFVETGDDSGMRKLLKDTEGIDVPESETTVFHAGILKSAQYCVNLPEEIKAKAFAQCIEMGFNPFMK